MRFTLCLNVSDRRKEEAEKSEASFFESRQIVREKVRLSAYGVLFRCCFQPLNTHTLALAHTHHTLH